MTAANMARMARMRQMERMVRPPMSPLPYIINKIRANMLRNTNGNRGPKIAVLKFGRPKIALLRVSRPLVPPMPRPQPKQLPTTRTIRIVPTRAPGRRFTPPNRVSLPRPFPMIPRPFPMIRPFPVIPRPVPTMVLSNRGPEMGFRPMQKMHFNEPEIPQIPRAPRVTPASKTQIPPDFPQYKPFPQIPVPEKEPVGSPKELPALPAIQFQPPRLQEGILPVEEQQMMQVDLPRDPVQMPDLIVEQVPKHQGMWSH